MRVIRRTQLGAAAAAVALSGMFFAPAAMAATPAHSAVAVVVPAQAAGYATGGATVTLSATVFVQGDTVTATVNGAPGRVYSATVFSSPMSLGTKAADSTGTAVFTFSTKDLSVGAHRVEVTDTVTGNVATASFSVTPANAGTAPGGTSNQAGGAANGSNNGGGGALAFTGAEAVIPLSVLGIILIGGGAAAVVAGRTRKASSDA